jgi:DNA-binding CsgD family transcriptional regulator
MIGSKKEDLYYVNLFVSDSPVEQNKETIEFYDKTIPKFPEEAIYIYAFGGKKLIYTKGWEEVLGYNDNEITLEKILFSTTAEYAPFANDLNENAIKFIMNHSEDLEQYSFTIEVTKIKKNGNVIPLICRVAVFKASNGKPTHVIGRFQINRNIRLGKIMYYAAYGPNKTEFEDYLNKELFKHFAISYKEKEALDMVAKGLSFKEIAHQLNVSQSAIEKRILPLYKKFGVKSLSHLISFASDNLIINI